MPIELNKILRDIAEERFLKPTTANAKKDEIENAWMRVAKKSNLSVHETKSIFKVLQKKYEQERIKEQSTWKLFGVMNEIHSPADDEDDDESDISMEENEEYEMLEVDEEQQHENQQNDTGEIENARDENQKTLIIKKSNTEMNSDGESPKKSKSDASHENSPEPASEKQSDTKLKSSTSPHREEKKVLNSLLSPNSARATKAMTATSAAALALQKKGITLKKATPAQKPQPSQAQQQTANASLLRNTQITESKTIKLPESIKRKLNEDITLQPSTNKKMLLGQPSGNLKQVTTKAISPKTFSQSKISHTGSLLLKKDSDEKNLSNSTAENISQNTTTMTAAPTNSSNTAAPNTPTITTHNGLKLITFPAETKDNTNSSSNASLNVITLPIEGKSLITNGIATNNATNGISTTRIEELDFSDHVLISTSSANNNHANSVNNKSIQNESIAKAEDTCPPATEDSINLCNFSNDLPRAFFNNLCNSKRYEAFALYVANILNRMDPPTAARLEVTIMRTLLDAQGAALEKA